MPEVDRVYQIIIEWFSFNIKSWQVSILVNITLKKKDVCTIISINTSKSLVYQVIPVVTRGFVLVISPTIALMET